MRRTDRYLLSEMIIPASIGVLMLLLLLVGNWLYALLNLLYGGKATWREVLEVLMYRTPSVLLLAIPGALLLGTALALNRLERDRELLALRMSGVRLTRLVLPYIITGVIFSGAIFWLQETVIPVATHRAVKAQRKMAWRAPTSVLEAQSDVVLRINRNYVYIQRVEPSTQTLYGVIICMMESTGYPTWLTVPIAENHDGHWMFKPNPATNEMPRMYKFNAQGKMTDYTDITGQDSWLNMKEDVWGYVSDQPSTPDEMTFRQLRSYQQGLRGAGVGVAPVVPLSPDGLIFSLNRKIAAPLAALVGVLIAIPLSVHFGRSGGYVGLLLSVLVAFFFVVAQQWAQSLSVNHLMNPIIAAWAPNAIFGVLGVVLLIREE
ncbi:MAG: LptF/LptG family permease [Armatimonadota bacterium]